MQAGNVGFHTKQAGVEENSRRCARKKEVEGLDGRSNSVMQRKLEEIC